ncbi:MULTISPECIES: hypothetical protein [unclassified Spiroplasma]
MDSTTQEKTDLANKFAEKTAENDKLKTDLEKAKEVFSDNFK